MEERHAATVVGVPVSALRWGLIIFVGASVLGFLATFLLSEDWAQDIASLQRFNPVWFLPAAGLSILSWLGGGLRIKALVGPHDSRVSFFKCVQISVASTAMSYLTPSSTGSGPATIYGLMRQGMSFGRATAANAVSFLTNVIFLSLAGLVAWALGAGGKVAYIRLPVAGLSAAALFKWSAWLFGASVAVIVVMALLPDVARGVIRRMMGREHPRMERVLFHFDELHAGIAAYWRSGKNLFLLAVLSGSLHFGARFVLGYVVLKGFVIEAPFVEVVLLHIMLQYLLFFMPTPSGAGIGELLTAAVMAPFLTPGLVIPYTVVWRIFLNYGTVAVGGSLLMGWVGADGAR
ncbi:MAG: flippase-like domain-containing protein [Gemmatimonadota bacterium]|nr:MAG: flippase-like domain-containing protein [Gemmatimonadota bacterium]